MANPQQGTIDSVNKIYQVVEKTQYSVPVLYCFFEQVAIEVIQACSSVSAASKLLGLDWDATHGIMKRAVQRGMSRRNTDSMEHIGIDEKSFGKGHDYVSVLTDLDQGRVLELVPGRTQESAEKLLKTLPESQRAKIKAVAMDMWQAFMSASTLVKRLIMCAAKRVAL